MGLMTIWFGASVVIAAVGFTYLTWLSLNES